MTDGELLSGIAPRQPAVTIATTVHREQRQREVPATGFPRLHFHIITRAGSMVMMSHRHALWERKKKAEGVEELSLLAVKAPHPPS